MHKLQKTIIDLFDIEKLTPEKGAEMIDRLAKLIFQATLVRVLPFLSDEEFTEYEKILEKQEGPEVLLGFFERVVPTFGQIFEEEAEILRAELAGEFKSAGVEA